MREYQHQQLEAKWRQKWQQEGLYTAENGQDKPKFYVLDMFPYPSGAGLHVGHPKGYIATDVVTRCMMMQGYNVLHPMGWDAFGLPAENYALKTGVHPTISTADHIVNYKRQLDDIGLAYDWNREINTTDPDYYRWTQWTFLEMFKRGLVYESHEPINWCPTCKTGLANEDLENGLCERCGTVVEKKPLRQWAVRITDYANRLLADLDKLPDWEDSIKEMQRYWIGRSVGAEINFKVIINTSGVIPHPSREAGAKAGILPVTVDQRLDSRLRGNDTGESAVIKVFTTRPDTIFGATYLVISPEHELINELGDAILNLNEVQGYISQVKNKSDMERTDLNKDKSGIELQGVKALHPVTGHQLPIFAADYVLSGYGTGAIMAVPAHDERDHEFALKYNLPIIKVVVPPALDQLNTVGFNSLPEHTDIRVVDDCYTAEGLAINSDFLDGLSTAAAKEKIIIWLTENKIGQAKVQYKLKDWVCLLYTSDAADE